LAILTFLQTFYPYNQTQNMDWGNENEVSAENIACCDCLCAWRKR
jgi:hypothetical protein